MIQLTPEQQQEQELEGSLMRNEGVNPYRRISNFLFGQSPKEQYTNVFAGQGYGSIIPGPLKSGVRNGMLQTWSNKGEAPFVFGRIKDLPVDSVGEGSAFVNTRTGVAAYTPKAHQHDPLAKAVQDLSTAEGKPLHRLLFDKDAAQVRWNPWASVDVFPYAGTAMERRSVSIQQRVEENLREAAIKLLEEKGLLKGRTLSDPTVFMP